LLPLPFSTFCDNVTLVLFAGEDVGWSRCVKTTAFCWFALSPVTDAEFCARNSVLMAVVLLLTESTMTLFL
jgi:hypothetical protein